jgi:hypothetical protein
VWLTSALGFFSIVRKPGEEHLTVRARVRGDLVALRQHYLPSLSDIVEGAGTDYPYRATVPAEDLACAMGRMVLDIDYPNFKSAVLARQGLPREKVYARVWGALLGLEGLDPDDPGAGA